MALSLDSLSLTSPVPREEAHGQTDTQTHTTRAQKKPEAPAKVLFDPDWVAAYL
jgi:hypothetical protein